MSLKKLLQDCVTRGQEMTQAIAIAQFGDDSPEARRITRRWGITEVADLIGVTPQAIRDAEKSGRLPAPDFEMRGRIERRAGYTIDQINSMRAVFGNPNQRPQDKNPVALAVMSHKGGVYKTSSAVHQAQWLALQGHRVLLVEGNDPQGTASMYHGYVPDLHIHAEDTLLPFYLGERDNAEYAIKPTCWPGLDIIPSCLALHRIETDLMQYHAQGKLPHPPHLMLRAAIESVWDNYDVIVIDSAPNLGTGTINVVCAADVIVVATPAELFDYASVLQFFTMLLDLLESVDLGGFEPTVRLLLTKYSLTTGNQSRWMEEQIRNTWGSMVLRQVVRVTDEVGKGQIKMRTVFEQAANQRSTLNAWRNAVSIWDPVCREIFDDLIKPRWENE
ncbi:TPA: plasmid-partitioning protein SopA [Shigella sonnei]|uniref:plasmid-partitioning protein SopA n=1 Tax=Enterobacteriaceae TaxID=543 RepID=UPI000DA4E1A2|nr:MULTISPECIES: plasmid-partitioning protein SopA [Enterobacteriaceae]EFX2201484.1 plasmid-partitioning protein SopA [Shigella sonnei]EES7171062.1 plasmid-partitioning protein SopA [Escherichia coli]EFX2326701.1 plasmid-partitioning protein SopA [Shigella sonnei]EFX2894821.1 plasmid-partitioning protein SopA [Shigella sonnei]EFX3328391.1 plasmid-partitioning protein SopA [Shigella sonnei]